MRGLQVFEMIALSLFERGIPLLTVYALSYENCIYRDRRELEVLENVLELGLDILKSWVEKNIVAVRFYGEKNLLSEKLRSRVEELLDSSWSSFRLNVGLCYKHGVDQNNVSQLHPIDLIIRTGGYSRLSGFFPSLSSYAEIYVTEKLWPDFTEGDLEEAITWFMRQRRNFGK